MRPHRWRSSAACCCGCCAWASRRFPRWRGSAPGWWRSARSPLGAAPGQIREPPSPATRRRPVKAITAQAPAGGAGEREPGPRRRGSWPWSPAGTGRWRTSRSPTCPGSAASWPPRSASTRARPARRCAATSCPCATGAPGDALLSYFALLVSGLLVAGRAALVLGPARRGCPGSGSGTCGCGCICGCIRAGVTPPCSSCGCGGAGWRRSAARAGPAGPCRCGGGCAARGTALGAAGPGAVPARAAGAGGGAPAAHGAAPDRQDRAARQDHPALPRPGRVHHDQARRVPADLRDPVRLGPVHVFNPQRVGGVPSTFRWNPVARVRRPGDGDPPGRRVRARGQHAGTEDATFWTAKAADYLRCLFHAAALAGGDMRLVARWALGSAEPAEDILAQAGAGSGPPSWPSCAARRRRPPRRSRWCCPGRWGSWPTRRWPGPCCPAMTAGWTSRRSSREAGTLYLIAESEHDDSPVAPLFAAMAGEIHYHAAQIGQATPGGRLDPPLLMALDEIVQTCPVPLPAWLADSGGKGIQLITVAHGEAQLRTRWGTTARRSSWTPAAVKVCLPGITDTATLRMASELCGQAAYREHRRTTPHPARVLTPDMIRQLPAGFALVIRGGRPGHRPAAAPGRTPPTGAPGARRRAARPRRRGRSRRRRPGERRPPWRPAAGTRRTPRPRDGAAYPGADHGEPEALTAVLLQLATLTEKLSALDHREAGHPPSSASGSPPDRARQRHQGHPGRPGRDPAGLTAWTGGRRPGRPAGRDRPGDGGEPAATSRPRRRGSGSSTARPATRLSPSSVPGWSRYTGPGMALAAASATAGSSTRCACTSWTGSPSCGRCCTSRPAGPPGPSPGRRNGRPGCYPPSPSSWPAKPAAATTPPAATAARPGRGDDRPPAGRVAAPGYAAPAGRCSLPARAASFPPPGTGSSTPPPTPARSPGGGRQPDANVAIATGQPGPDVLDIDQHGRPRVRRLQQARAPGS